MVFRECSIGGRVYSGDPKEISEDPQDPKEPLIKPVNSSSGSSGSSSDPTAAPTSAKVQYRFHDEQLNQDLHMAVHAGSGSENAPHARALNGFLTVLGLCHTVLAATDPVTGAIEYKAQSPDEAALVRAAADVGYVFKGKEPGEVLLLQTPFSDGEEMERYQLLNILEFTSARKRMSVVVRRVDEGQEDRRLFLLCKGADNVVFERLRKGAGAEAEALKESTEKHLSEFASRGLRTLTLAYKVIPGRWTFAFAFLRKI